MEARHRDREEDRFVGGVAGALEALHAVDDDVLGGGPAATVVTAHAAFADREVLDPPGGPQVAHPVSEGVHRSGHGSE